MRPPDAYKIADSRNATITTENVALYSTKLAAQTTRYQSLKELRRRHPRLVICSITGYGESGPYRDMKACDLLIQAETALALDLSNC